MNFVLPTHSRERLEMSLMASGGLEPGLAHNTYSGKDVLENTHTHTYTTVMQSLCFSTKVRKQHILENKVGVL